MLEYWLKNNKGHIYLTGCLFTLAIITRIIADNSPSPIFVIATGSSSLAAVALLSRIIPDVIANPFNRALFAVLCLADCGILNMIVKVANDGYMPVSGLPSTYRFWMPMHDAKFRWMGDWLFDGYSIRIFLVLIGLISLIYCITRWWTKHKKITNLTVDNSDNILASERE